VWFFYFCPMSAASPIGVFDSGYGGLTVLKEIVAKMPSFDYIYLGDNARSPYGPRSFETVYRYTLECVNWFFRMGCPLVVLACNTASAKALRTIQQHDLPNTDPTKRVLGVIRPTTEVIGKFSKTKEVGILGTNGTVLSNSYPIEINKFYPELAVYQQACPMWVPLVENREYASEGADYFIKQELHQLFARSGNIDTVLLACTHYPLLKNKIESFLPSNVTVISQGEIVADSLEDYLNRHAEIREKCSNGSSVLFYTTDSAKDFNENASIFYGKRIEATHIDL
jgi:glutamate racemase